MSKHRHLRDYINELLLEGRHDEETKFWFGASLTSKSIDKQESKPIPRDEEMERAEAYWVRTGDPSLINDLNKQRELDNWYRNRWD